MSRFITPIEIIEGKVPEDFGVDIVKGSSLTIPGQGSDLSQIVASVVKLPPIDERTFDVGSREELDERSLSVKTALDGLYPAEGRNLAEDAQERQKARKEAKQENSETKDEGVSTEDDNKK